MSRSSQRRAINLPSPLRIAATVKAALKDTPYAVAGSLPADNPVHLLQLQLVQVGTKNLTL